MRVCLNLAFQRVVVLKDQANKRAHEHSAHLACEAAGSIRTVAALTREDDCLQQYSQSLEGPLEKSNRSAVFSNILYAISQAMSFFVIALVFWYGSRLVATQELSTFRFFVCLMVRTAVFNFVFVEIFSWLAILRAPHSVPFKLGMSSHLCLICLRPEAQAPTSSKCWIWYPK